MPVEIMTHNLQCSPLAIGINILLGEISNDSPCYLWHIIFSACVAQLKLNIYPREISGNETLGDNAHEDDLTEPAVNRSLCKPIFPLTLISMNHICAASSVRTKNVLEHSIRYALYAQYRLEEQRTF